MTEQFARHDGAGVEAGRTARDEIAAAHRDQVGRARPGADEVYGHGAAPDTATAQVAAPITRRGLMSRADGPAAASAAASATECTPVSASTRPDRVAVRSFAACNSASRIRTRSTPRFAAAVAMPVSPCFAT